MKSIIITFLTLIQVPLLSQWNEIERPKSIQTLININSGSDFLVGSREDPYFSFDGGETWEKRINGLPEERGSIDKIIVKNDLIFISTSITNSIRSQYMMYSTDRGANWNVLIDSLLYDNRNLISDFSINNNNNIFLLSYSGKLLKSSNFGNNWDTIQNWYSKYGLMHLIDVKNDTIILANKGGTDSGGGSLKASLIVSIDGGSTWEIKSNGISTSGLKCLEFENERIYIGGDNGFYFSNDFGLSWRSPGTLVVGAKVNDFEVVNDTVFLATENGLFKAKDLFKGWEEIPFFKGKRVWQIHFGFGKLFTRFINNDFSNHSSFYSLDNDFNNYLELNFLSESTLNSFAIDYPRILFATDKMFLKEDLYSNNKILFETDTTLELNSISAFSKSLVCTYLPTTPNANNRNIVYSNNNGSLWEKFVLNTNINNLNIRDLFLLNSDTLLITDGITGVYILNDFKYDIELIQTDNNEINDFLTKINTIFRKNNKIYYFGGNIILESDTNLKNWKSYSNSISIASRLLSYSKGNSDYFIDVSGLTVEPKTVNIYQSKDNGLSWVKIKSLFPNNENIVFKNVYTIQNFVFVSTTNGIFYSKDDGTTFEEINDGISNLAKTDGGEFHLYGDKILFCSQSGIFHRDLEELGITLTSIEKTEERNYLYTFPPFPQPTKQEVKISTYWDSSLPFTIDDVEIYNLAGVKINTENTLSIKKETNYNGHIIWDTSGEQAGIYIVNIKHGTQSLIQKVMVQK